MEVDRPSYSSFGSRVHMYSADDVGEVILCIIVGYLY